MCAIVSQRSFSPEADDDRSAVSASTRPLPPAGSVDGPGPAFLTTALLPNLCAEVAAPRGQAQARATRIHKTKTYSTNRRRTLLLRVGRLQSVADLLHGTSFSAPSPSSSGPGHARHGRPPRPPLGHVDALGRPRRRLPGEARRALGPRRVAEVVVRLVRGRAGHDGERRRLDDRRRRLYDEEEAPPHPCTLREGAPVDIIRIRRRAVHARRLGERLGCSTWATWLSHDCNLILSSKASRASSEPMRCFSVSSNANKFAVPPQYTPACAWAMGSSSLAWRRFFGLPLAVKNSHAPGPLLVADGPSLVEGRGVVPHARLPPPDRPYSSSRAAFASCKKLRLLHD